MTGLARRPEKREKTAVYRFYDGEGRLLYVGVTKEPEVRFDTHKRERAETWWPLAVRHTIEWFDDRQAAAQAEVDAITNEAPLHNVSSIPAPTLVSASAAVPLSSYDLDACEWVTPSDVARRVVQLGIYKSFTRQRVMQLAQGDPAWPIPREQWRSLANMWLFPWPPVEDYLRARIARPGRRTDLGK